MSSGGRREGAGRKAMPAAEKRKFILIYLKPDEIELVERYAANSGQTRQEYIRDRILRDSI